MMGSTTLGLRFPLLKMGWIGFVSFLSFLSFLHLHISHNSHDSFYIVYTRFIEDLTWFRSLISFVATTLSAFFYFHKKSYSWLTLAYILFLEQYERCNHFTCTFLLCIYDLCCQLLLCPFR